MSQVRRIGLDVHAATIAVAVAKPDGEVRALEVIPNQADSLLRLVKKLGPVKSLRACDEAGSTGDVVYWQVTGLGVACEVVAPMLESVTAGDGRRGRGDDRRSARGLTRPATRRGPRAALPPLVGGCRPGVARPARLAVQHDTPRPPRSSTTGSSELV